MILEIVKYPEPVLERPAEPVTEFNEELRKFVDDMFESMYAAKGIGLAAPQVGVSKRLTVIDLSFKEKSGRQDRPHQSGDHSCVKASSTKRRAASACPDIREKVSRAAKVKVRAQDVDGELVRTGRRTSCWHAPSSTRSTTSTASCSFKRVSALKRDLILRKIRKLQKAGEW